jgi:hypothetical protein
VTNDRGLEYGQDISHLPIAVIVLLAPSNTLEGLRPLLPTLQQALDKLQPCEFIKIAAS